MDAVATNSLAPQVPAHDRERVRALRQMARLAVGGSQFADLPPDELIRCLGSYLSGAVPERATPDSNDRFRAIQRVLDCGDSGSPFLRVCAGTDLPTMLVTVARHAAGFLAPLTGAIEIGWTADFLLSGVRLVDLPGLGVANDRYREYTSGALEDLDAVLLVVDRAGLTQSSADLLRRAGIRKPDRGLDRFSPHLLVAVTKLDLSVDEALVRSRRDTSAAAGWQYAQASIATRATDMVRAQFALDRRRSLPAGCDATEPHCEQLDVFPVFPRDYQRLHRSDPDEPTALRSETASGIPALCARLEQLGATRTAFFVRHCEHALQGLLHGPARDAGARCLAQLHEIVTPGPRS